ncbi:hypothetical protein BDZ89DRAFT_1071408 [Hymenopellis radicata]|nr:hypothetical protein BDZ89DRAFT_1071408 [Hymenopellis radicata]
MIEFQVARLFNCAAWSSQSWNTLRPPDDTHLSTKMETICQMSEYLRRVDLGNPRD